MPIVNRRFILTKGPPWGFRIYLDNSDILTVSKVRKHSPAESSNLKSGDQIISVNGQQLFGFSHSEAVLLIDTTFGTLDIHVARFETTSTQHLTFDKLDFITPECIEERIHSLRCERTPEETKVPACTPEPEEHITKTVEESVNFAPQLRSPSHELKVEPESEWLKEDYSRDGLDNIIQKEPQFYVSPSVYDGSSTDDKMSMARRIASSFYDPVNKDSKGAKIFERQRKRVEKYTIQKLEANGLETSGFKFNNIKWPDFSDQNKRSISPRSKPTDSPVHIIPVPPPPKISRILEINEKFSNVNHKPVSKETSFDIASALHNGDSRGAQIFAKQRSRSQKWTLTTPDTPSSDQSLSVSRKEADYFDKNAGPDYQQEIEFPSMSKNRNQAYYTENTNINQQSQATRRPTHVIHRSGSQGPTNPLKHGNKLTIRTSTTVATAAPAVPATTFQSNIAQKWKAVKFNIPQKS